ncbi:MAG: M20 family peptidase [Betaproteobacteria bacterium]|nr:M20 family peptidase [Betaproteobacteria bacterium]
MKELLNLVSEDRLIEWAQTFVRRPSEQSAQFEADPAVQSFIGECVQPLLEGLGHRTRRDAMGNLIAETGPAGAPRAAMLLAYAMTHPAASMRAPFAGELTGGGAERAVRGRGVAEQKGALAAAIAAFHAAAQSNPRCRIVLAVSTAGETGQHKAAESLLGAIGRMPQAAIVAIGSGGRIALANKGRLDVHIDVRGRSSHSSTPWLGVNAVIGAQAVIERLATLDIGRDEHPLLGRATLTPTSIRSFPEATHTIQDLVKLTFDRRLLPGQDPAAALRQIEQAIADMPPWVVEARAGAFQHPAEIPADGQFMRCARAGLARMGLADPGTFASHGCVDAGLLVRKGCEASMWGPGEQTMWHTDEERLPVRALVEGAAAYFGFLLAFQEAADAR